MAELPTQAAKVLRFWFGDPDSKDTSYKQRRKLWFGKDPEFDRAVIERFRPLYNRAVAGMLDSWQTAPLTALALVIVFDQFPRNMFRGTPEAFATDNQALAVAKGAIELGFGQFMEPIQRIFLYLPLEHSENLEDQNEAVALYQILCDPNPELSDTLDSAVRHQAVIKQFGRFPHRNAILGRESTPEEVEFLQQPGSSF